MDLKTLLEACFLGIIEGLTEFIPVSSTGHLILADHLLGFKGPEGKVFEIVIQLGAILAVCFLYRAKIFEITSSLLTQKKSRIFASNIILAFLPAAILGAFLHGFIKNALFSPYIVATSLIIGGFIILLIESKIHLVKFNTIESIKPKTAIYIGFMQSLAMIPGVSRSGATIMGSILLGVNRKTATEFSFFLAIPTMLAATCYDIYKNYHNLNLSDVGLIAVGFICAFISGLLVVKHLVNFISTHGFKPFAWYRIFVGGIMLLILSWQS